MKISEIVKKKPKSIEIMIKYGLYCVSCPIAGMETLEQGARAHGLDSEIIKRMLDEINKSK